MRSKSRTMNSAPSADRPAISKCSNDSALSRRSLLHAGVAGFVGSLTAGGAAILAPAAAAAPAAGPSLSFGFGLVTYQWGKDWDLPTLLANCQAANLLAVELRTTHAHGVEPTLNAAQRAEVKQRFADSPVTCLGPGSNERFDSPDPVELAKAIEASKAFLQLSHDIGGSGVKVKPDRFYDDVPKEKTIAQIAEALRELAGFGADLGQEVRLEVHGGLTDSKHIEQVMLAADHPNAKVCWNSNPADLEGDGLEENFRRLRPFFGATCHVHDLTSEDYPWAKLFGLLTKSDYAGWALLEEGKVPEDPAAALISQRAAFDRLTGLSPRP